MQKQKHECVRHNSIEVDSFAVFSSDPGHLLETFQTQDTWPRCPFETHSLKKSGTDCLVTLLTHVKNKIRNKLKKCKSWQMRHLNKRQRAKNVTQLNVSDMRHI